MTPWMRSSRYTRAADGFARSAPLLLLLLAGTSVGPRRAFLDFSPPRRKRPTTPSATTGGWDLSDSESEKATQAALMAEVGAIARRLEALEKHRLRSRPHSGPGATGGSGSSSATIDNDRVLADFLRRMHAEMARRDSGQPVKAASSAEPTAPGVWAADSGPVRELIAGLSCSFRHRDDPNWVLAGTRRPP